MKKNFCIPRSYLNSNFTKRILKGTILLSAGNFLSRILISLSIVYLARVLTKESFGQYSLLKSTVDSFLIFATAGLSYSATNFIAKERKNKNEKLTSLISTIFMIGFFLSSLISVLIYSYSEYLSVKFLGDKKLEYGLVIVAISIFFASFNSIQQGVLIGFESFKNQMIVNILQGVFIFSFTIFGALYADFIGAFIGLMFSMIATVIVNFFTLRNILQKNNINISFTIDRKIILDVLKFTLPLFISSILTTPVLWYLNTEVARTNNGFKEIGTYNAVYIFPGLILTINSVLSNVILPIILNSDNITKIQEMFSQLINWFISIYIIIFISCFPNLVLLVLGNNFNLNDISTTLLFSLSSVLIITHRQGVAINLIKKNKTIYSVYSMGQWAITTIIIFLIFEEPNSDNLSKSLFIGYFINTIIFIPFFVHKKIISKYIYFNKYKIVLFFITFIIILINYYITFNFLLNIILFLVEIITVSILIYKMKNNVTQEDY